MRFGDYKSTWDYTFMSMRAAYKRRSISYVIR
jgi:hypothetical protein